MGDQEQIIEKEEKTLYGFDNNDSVSSCPSPVRKLYTAVSA